MKSEQLSIIAIRAKKLGLTLPRVLVLSVLDSFAARKVGNLTVGEVEAYVIEKVGVGVYSYSAIYSMLNTLNFDGMIGKERVGRCDEYRITHTGKATIKKLYRAL